jgi:hypothetical protein
MFGELTFIGAGDVCSGVNKDELVIRLDPDAEEAALRAARARPMDFTPRPTRGLVTIDAGDSKGRRPDRWVAQAVGHPEPDHA